MSRTGSIESNKVKSWVEQGRSMGRTWHRTWVEHGIFYHILQLPRLRVLTHDSTETVKWCPSFVVAWLIPGKSEDVPISRTKSNNVRFSWKKSSKVEKCPVKSNEVENGHRLNQEVEIGHRSTEKFENRHHSTVSVESWVEHLSPGLCRYTFLLLISIFLIVWFNKCKFNFSIFDTSTFNFNSTNFIFQQTAIKFHGIQLQLDPNNNMM